MSQKIDLVPLIEWAIKRKDTDDLFKTPAPRKKALAFGDIDLPALIMAERQRAEAFGKLLKDIEKVDKKEEKKGWDKLTTPQLTMIMIAVVPLYMVFLQKIFH